GAGKSGRSCRKSGARMKATMAVCCAWIVALPGADITKSPTFPQRLHPTVPLPKLRCALRPSRDSGYDAELRGSKERRTVARGNAADLRRAISLCGTFAG